MKTNNNIRRLNCFFSFSFVFLFFWELRVSYGWLDGGRFSNGNVHCGQSGLEPFCARQHWSHCACRRCSPLFGLNHLVQLRSIDLWPHHHHGSRVGISHHRYGNRWRRIWRRILVVPEITIIFIEWLLLCQKSKWVQSRDIHLRNNQHVHPHRDDAIHVLIAVRQQSDGNSFLHSRHCVSWHHVHRNDIDHSLDMRQQIPNSIKLMLKQLTEIGK